MKNRMKCLLIPCVIAFSLWGYTRCSEGTYVVQYSNVVKSYFSCYKPGSYFIYLNQDSSKRDSFYISFYNAGTIKSTKCCCYIPFDRYDIHSLYLTQGSITSSLGVYETRGGLYTNDTSIIQGGSSDGRIFDMIVVPGANQLSKTNQIVDTGTSVQIISAFSLGNNILPEVTQYKQNGYGDIYLAPGIGIAEFITNDLRDTFKITKYYIP